MLRFIQPHTDLGVNTLTSLRKTILKSQYFSYSLDLKCHPEALVLKAIIVSLWY